MFRYTVIICTKCRRHVQIIENNKKTTTCQNCGSVLNLDDLRFFYQCDNLEDAVTARTKLQSHILGQDNRLDSVRYMAFTNAVNSGSYTSSKPDKSKKSGFKKDDRKIIINLLESNSGEMDREELKNRASENGVNSNKFEKIVESMFETGELYSPSMCGTLKLVP
ncbi:MAG: DUF5817 domain-containing protein [Methanohalobium sp.]|uniref:DUF5817 domain-containing protein n=1 Tax=Methanohalobium sp. TaxID=2837493 RepID=UPI00397DE07A